MKLQKTIKTGIRIAFLLIASFSMNFFLNPMNAYGFNSVREITYKNINTVLTSEDLELQGNCDDYTFYIAPIGSDSAERINIPLSIGENIYLGTNDLTILGPQGIVTVKVVVTEASREVDRDGWTKIEASPDTRIVYVSSSEGNNAAGVSHCVYEIGITTPDDEPQGPFRKRLTPIMTDSTEPEGQASASSEFHRDAWRAFNRNYSSGWYASPSCWLQYEFVSPVVANEYTITASDHSVRHPDETAPKDWTFEGSHDGENWTTLDTVQGETDWGLGERRSFTFDNSTEYSYYRLSISTIQQQSERAVINELEIIGPSEELIPVATPSMANTQARSGYPDWILLKRGDVWNEDWDWGEDPEDPETESWSISRGGPSIEESFVVSTYGESDQRPRLHFTSISLRNSNAIAVGLDVWRLSSSGNNILYEDCKTHQSLGLSGNRNIRKSTGEASNLEYRRNILAEPSESNPWMVQCYWHGVDRLFLEENRFHNFPWMDPEHERRNRHILYIQDGNENVSLYRNIFTDGPNFNTVMNRGSERSMFRENILDRNRRSIINTSSNINSPLHVDGNVVIDSFTTSIGVSGIIHDTQDTVNNNIVIRGGTGISLSGWDDEPLGNICIRNNITYEADTPFSGDVETGDDVHESDNLFNEDIDFVDPDRTLGTYQEYVSGKTYTEHNGAVDVVDDGEGVYRQVEWQSGDKFDTAWRVTQDLTIIIDGQTYVIKEVVDDETIILDDSYYSTPESELTSVSYTYEGKAHRNFTFNSMQQSRHNWNWDYSAVRIQDYFREGFAIGYASPGAPEEVADLKAETLTETDGEVVLTWTAPGKHGDEGNNTEGHYEVRYATYPAGEKPLEWWNSISTDTAGYFSGTEKLQNPQNVGETEKRDIRGLYPGATFYFGIRVYNSETEKSGFDKMLSIGNPASAISGNANPKPPSKLRFNYIGTNARLVWDKSPSSVLDRYIVYRSTGSGYYKKYKSTSDTKHTISLNEEKNYFAEHDKYYFTVTAVNIVDSTSTHSNEVQLTLDVTPPVIEDLTARTRVLARREIKVSVTDDRQVYEVGGGYRSLGSDSEHYPELEFIEEPEEGSSSYEGRAEIDGFYISSEGFEYYITASDAFNTSTTTWVQVRSVKDLPEQGFLTPNNPELIFGSEVEEVLITDVRGNEVFSKKRDGSNHIVWNPSRDGSIPLESGLYIYRIKTDGDYKYGSVVIAK